MKPVSTRTASTRAVLLALALGAGPLGAGEPLEPEDAVSRELSVFSGDPGEVDAHDAVSRELSVFSGEPGVVDAHDAVSRELSVFSGDPGEVDAHDAVSRELSIYTPLAAADLVVSDVIAPESASAGIPTEVTFTVTNRSPYATDAGSWLDAVFLTVGEELAEDLREERYFLGPFPNPRVLESGGSYRHTVPIALPARVSGTYRIAVYADARLDGAYSSHQCEVFDLREENECNNVAWSEPFTIEIPPLQPDLEVLPETPDDPDEPAEPEIRFVEKALSATRFEVEWTVRNTGGAATPTGSWRDAVYLSRDRERTIAPDDCLLDCLLEAPPRDGSPLPAGGADRTRLASGVLGAEAEGTYFVKIATDIDDLVWEPGAGGEANNVTASARPLVVALGPSIDLVPLVVEGPPAAVPGEEVEVYWCAENQGAPPRHLAFAWRDAVYLSADLVPDPDERLAARPHATSVDAAGNVLLPDYCASLPVAIPPHTPPGVYHFLVVLDDEEEVYEGLDPEAEANNLLASAPFEVEPPASDLAIEIDFDATHRLPDARPRRARLEISFRVTNVGTTATPGSYWVDRVLLARAESPGADDTLLAALERRGSLRAGESYIREAAVEVPAVEPGSYFLLFECDAGNGAGGHVPEPSPESGLNLAVKAFTVREDAPDLAVTSLTAPGKAVSGRAVRVSWTVENLGSLATPGSFWTDRVYLSRDEALDRNEDRPAGSALRTEPLGKRASYEAAADLALPLDLAGAFHVIVAADDDGQVLESDETKNNVRAAPVLLEVERAGAADLVVSDVSAPSTAVSGQRLAAGWTVTNEGEARTNACAWTDAVYLSRDQVLDRDLDVFLGVRPREGTLEPRAAPGGVSSYTVSGHSLDLPPGLSGPYFVIALADKDGAVDEAGRTENSWRSAPLPVEIELPPLSDLVAAPREPAAAPEAALGERLRVEWRVTNAGGGPVAGRFFDTVYLSADEVWDVADPPLGRFEVEIPLGAPLLPGGESHAASGEAAVPALKPRDYRIFVRTDVLNHIPELDEGNNLGGPAGTVRITAPPLVLDGEPLETRLGAGESRYFALATPAGETVRVDLAHGNAGAWTQLYVRYEDAPTPGQFDFRFNAPAAASQTVRIPTTRAGTYYVLARAVGGVTAGSGESEVATLRARTVPFAVEGVVPGVIGDRGRVTLTVAGSRFEPSARVHLERDGGPRLEARHVEVRSGIEIAARFLLDGLPRGAYDLAVESPDGALARAPEPVHVEEAAPPVVVIDLEAPPPLRRGTSSGAWVSTATNHGNVDAEYLFLLGAVESPAQAAALGREVLGVRSSSPFAGSSEREGLLLPSAIVRSLAPGASATFSTTLRAGSDPGPAIALGVGAALLSTARFIEFELEASEAARRAALADPTLLAASTSESTLTLAQERAAWRARWLEGLVRAGLLDPADVPGPEGAGGPSGPPPGEVTCGPPPPDVPPPAFHAEMPSLLCSVWLERLLATGADAMPAGAGAAGVFAMSRGPLTAAGIPCAALDDFRSSTSYLSWSVRSAEDPNEKEGLDGVGDRKLVPQKKPIRYRIDFENVSATSAARIVIRDRLDSALLDPGTIRFGAVRFGEPQASTEGGVEGSGPESPVDARCGIGFEAGADAYGPSYLQHTVDLTGTYGVEARVLAGYDDRAGEAFWVLQAIDPRTGDRAASALLGLLPGRGQGSVEFSVAPRRTVPTGSIIENDATITFDFEEPDRTGVTAHLLDADAPASAVAPLPPRVEGTEVEIQWSGADPAGGSGLAAYTVYVSKDGGACVPFVVDTGETRGSFPGEMGHHYSFYSVARDHAGNLEEPPGAPDAATAVGPEPRFRRGDTDADGRKNITDAIFLLNFLFLGGKRPLCFDAADADDTGVLNITDAIYLLNFLFLGGPPPPAPGAEDCGTDETGDRLEECRYPEGMCSS
jgi:hypothetical protein